MRPIVLRSAPPVVPWLAVLASLALLSGCTRVLVPLGAPAAPPLTTDQAEETRLAGGNIPEGPIVYSIFGVPAGGLLLARQPAGISGTVVAELPGDLRRVRLTGQTTVLGSSTWTEIEVPSVGTGWINLWNLTEDVAGETFCADPRVPALLDSFLAALRARSGEALAQTISPQRGLVLRHDWWNDEVVIPLNDAAELMRTTEPVAWGVQRGSGAPIVGSFRDRLLPELDTLLEATSTQACNAIQSGETGYPARWPEEYTRLNYVSYFVPAPEPGPVFNWRAWAVGVEYVDGVPYVAILIRYQGDL
jgi:hypothetical protein